MKISGINRRSGENILCARFNSSQLKKHQIKLERSQGTAPCPSSGGGCISPDTYSACSPLFRHAREIHELPRRNRLLNY